MDHSEYNLYSITEELKDSNIVPVMQTVRKIEFLKNFEKYRPQIVIHAAAYKHVPLVEHNILEGITNNIIGTKKYHRFIYKIQSWKICFNIDR